MNHRAIIMNLHPTLLKGEDADHISITEVSYQQQSETSLMDWAIQKLRSRGCGISTDDAGLVKMVPVG